MSIYKASSINDLLSKDNLEKVVGKIKNIDIYPIDSSGLSGSKLYNLNIDSENGKQVLFLKVNNLTQDWLARASKDKGRELVVFKEGIYEKTKEFIDGVYIGYYKGKDTYAILMNNLSGYIGSDKNMTQYLNYVDTLAKFHSRFTEYDVYAYEELLSVDKYYDFLSVDKLMYIEEFGHGETSLKGWTKIKELLGDELYEKYNSMGGIDKYYPPYPKTFLHGDFRPDNTVYLNDENIRMIDFANSGYGPCTLDFFWYTMTSVEPGIDIDMLLNFYRHKLEEYMGYKYTEKTWNTMLEVGLIAACRMALSFTIVNTDMDDKDGAAKVNWYVDNLIFILKNRF